MDPITPAAAGAATAAAASTGPSLSTIFLAAAVDTLLFAWMHFTASGMAFGAQVAQVTGMTPSLSALAASSGMVATPMAGGAAPMLGFE